MIGPWQFHPWPILIFAADEHSAWVTAQIACYVYYPLWRSVGIVQ